MEKVKLTDICIFKVVHNRQKMNGHLMSRSDIDEYAPNYEMFAEAWLIEHNTRLI